MSAIIDFILATSTFIGASACAAFSAAAGAATTCAAAAGAGAGAGAGATAGTGTAATCVAAGAVGVSASIADFCPGSPVILVAAGNFWLPNSAALTTESAAAGSAAGSAATFSGAAATFLTVPALYFLAISGYLAIASRVFLPMSPSTPSLFGPLVPRSTLSVLNSFCIAIIAFLSIPPCLVFFLLSGAFSTEAFHGSLTNVSEANFAAANGIPIFPSIPGKPKPILLNGLAINPAICPPPYNQGLRSSASLDFAISAFNASL